MKRTTTIDYYGSPATLRATAILCKIGTQEPYFSLTGEITQNGRSVAGGRLHEEIVKAWPDLAPLAALHLSSIDGAPMHAEENGWYWLAGTFEHGMGQQFHGGNGNPPHANPLEVFAKLCRITMEEAQRIRREVELELGQPEESHGMDHLAGFKHSDFSRARAKWSKICNGMRARWAQEAREAIKQFNLEITE